MDRTPKFCLKLQIYRFILEFGQSPGDPPNRIIFI